MGWAAIPAQRPGYLGFDYSRVNGFLEDLAVLRKEGSVGPRYTGASGKSLEALLFYGVAGVGVVAGACPGDSKTSTREYQSLF